MIDVLNENLRSFVESYVDSLLAWDVILYLYHNASKASNIEDLADRLGRPASEIDQILKRLKTRGLVRINRDLEHSTFMVSDNFKKNVEPFVIALNQRQQRLAILAEVLRREYAS